MQQKVHHCQQVSMLWQGNSKIFSGVHVFWNVYLVTELGCPVFIFPVFIYLSVLFAYTFLGECSSVLVFWKCYNAQGVFTIVKVYPPIKISRWWIICVHLSKPAFTQGLHIIFVQQNESTGNLPITKASYDMSLQKQVLSREIERKTWRRITHSPQLF